MNFLRITVAFSIITDRGITIAESMFPDKARMVRSANVLWLVLTLAPVVYLVEAVIVTWGKGGFTKDQTLVLWLLFVFVTASAAQIGLTVFTQTGKTFMKDRAVYDPMGRTFHVLVIGSILSDAHSIYGLLLTLLSGSIFYGVGFSLVAWTSLFWVRGRFKQNLGRLPDSKPSSSS